MASRSRDARVVLVARGRFCGVTGAPRSRGDRRAARPFCRPALARTIGWRSAAVRLENARARHVASIQRPYATVDSRFTARGLPNTCESVLGERCRNRLNERLDPKALVKQLHQ